MTKKELIAKIAEKMDGTKKAADENLTAIVEVVTEALEAGEDVKIPGLGTFTVVERAAREGRNPATGEALHIEASKAPKFKASSALKEAVNA